MTRVAEISLVMAFCLSIGIADAQNISDEAMHHFDRGQAAVEMAKTPADYEAAINEFEKAATLAPDWPDVYYNLGLIQEKVDKYDDAIRNLSKYLELSPNASDSRDVKKFIAKIEYKLEKEEGIKTVYDMITSDRAEVTMVDSEIIDDGLGYFRFIDNNWQFRMNAGTLEAKNPHFPNSAWYGVDSTIRDKIARDLNIQEWEPVQVNGRFYNYKAVGLGCGHYKGKGDFVIYKMVTEVRGEIILFNPLRVKEIRMPSILSLFPYPKGYPQRFVSDVRGLQEVTCEWHLK